MRQLVRRLVCTPTMSLGPCLNAYKRQVLSLVLTFVGITMAISSKAAANPVEHQYRACIQRAGEELTADEKAKVKAFRAAVFAGLTPLRADSSLSGVKRYSETLIQTIETKISPEEVTPRLYPRFMFVIREEKLRRIIQQSIGLNHRDYVYYSKLAAGSILKQKAIDLDEFTKAHQQLLATLSVWYMEENDRKVGVAVPLALTMSRPEEFAAAFTVTNEVSETVAELQVINAQLAGDRAQFKKALALQAAYAVGGTLAFMSTFALGPVAVVRGGALAVQLGYRAITGARGAGMLVGGVGTPGALAPLTAYMTVSEAYRRSSALGTPVRCELEREAALANFGGQMMTAAAFGTGVGLVGVSAVGLSMATLRVTGVLAQGGMLYHGGMATWEAVNGFQYCQMSNQLKALEGLTPAAARDRDALALLARNECHARFQKAGKHGIEGITIFALYRELYLKGHLKEALEHGLEKAMGVMAYSSDSVPTVLKTTADVAVHKAAIPMVNLIRGPEARQAMAPLSEQIQQFLAKAGSPPNVATPLPEWSLSWP